MKNPVEIEDSRIGGPVTEGFRDLLQKAAAKAGKNGCSPFAVQHVAQASMGDLDTLNMILVKEVFKSAEMYFERCEL